MSIMQVCWSLMRYPRSKGIPYIMENGTFDQALVFMLRLFGIMLGLSVVENGIIFLITPVTVLDTIISILGFVFAWFFLKGLWLILAHFYVKATSNRDVTFKDTFMAVSYAMAFDLPITVIVLTRCCTRYCIEPCRSGYDCVRSSIYFGPNRICISYILYALLPWTLPSDVKDYINAYYYHCYCIYCTFNKCIYDVTSIGESYFINIKQYNT